MIEQNKLLGPKNVKLFKLYTYAEWNGKNVISDRADGDIAQAASL